MSEIQIILSYLIKPGRCAKKVRRLLFTSGNFLKFNAELKTEWCPELQL